jgi:hypothetical protein
MTDRSETPFWIDRIEFIDAEPWMHHVTHRSAERIELGNRVVNWMQSTYTIDAPSPIGSVWGIVA